MKATKEHVQKAQKIAKQHGVNKIFINSKCEFFTREDYAAASVGNKKSDYVEIDCSNKQDEVVVQIKNADSKKEKDMLKDIDKCTSIKDLEAIYNAEKIGENRKNVIAACEAKSEELSKKE